MDKLNIVQKKQISISSIIVNTEYSRRKLPFRRFFIDFYDNFDMVISVQEVKNAHKRNSDFMVTVSGSLLCIRMDDLHWAKAI